ncbi:MAG: hypothetical protein ACRDAP_10845, partial [Shewanella sp.]
NGSWEPLIPQTAMTLYLLALYSQNAIYSQLAMISSLTNTDSYPIPIVSQYQIATHIATPTAHSPSPSQPFRHDETS